MNSLFPKSSLKSATYKVSFATKAYRLLPKRLSGLGLIFMSHRVVSTGHVSVDPTQVLSTEQLARCLETIRETRAEIVTLDEVHARLASDRLSEPFVCFTFDDGYRDVLYRALPIFERFEAPFTIYVTTGFPNRDCYYWWGALERLVLSKSVLDFEVSGRRNELNLRTLSGKRSAFKYLGGLTLDKHEHTVRKLLADNHIDADILLDEDALSWEELRRLASSPLVTVGAHCVSHRNLRDLAADAVWQELLDSRAELETRLGRDVRHLAFPFGTEWACGQREFALARDARYDTAATTEPCGLYDRHRTDRWALPRISLDQTTAAPWQIRLHMSGVTGLVERHLRHPLLHGTT